MEKQRVKGVVTVAGADGKCCFIATTQDSKDRGILNMWWPYPLPVGAEVEVTVKVR